MRLSTFLRAPPGGPSLPRIVTLDIRPPTTTILRAKQLRTNWARVPAAKWR